VNAAARLVLACAAAFLASLAWPLATGRVFVYNDLAWFHLPVRFLYQQALAHGDSLLWTPAILSGLYLHGEGQGGLLHPWHLLLYRPLPLDVAFNLEMLASYAAAFGGVWWLLRRLAFDRAPARFGAFVFAFGGFMLLHHHHVNMVAVVAHLPWLLGAADALIVEARPASRRRAFAAIVLLVGSQCLIGFPQAVWWSLLALAAFAAFRATASRRRWPALLPCGAAVALGLLLGGIQLLPTADVAALSDRASAPETFALSYSLHPLNVVQLVSPYFFTAGAHTVTDYPWFHEFGIHGGAILPIALAWAWLRRAALPARRTLIVAATAFAVLMLVLALGRYGGLATLLAQLPVVGSLRAPARYVVLMQLALAIVAAIALEDLLAIRDGRHGRGTGAMPALWIPAALGVATLAINAGLVALGDGVAAPVSQAWRGVALIAAVTVLVRLAGRGIRWAAPALILVTAADLAVYGIGFVYAEAPRPLASLTERIPPPPPPPAAPADAYAAAPDTGPYGWDVLVLRGYRLTTGYVGLFPAVRYPLGSGEALRFSGTRWTFTVDGRRRGDGAGVARVRLLDDEGREIGGVARLTSDRPGRLAADVQTLQPATLAFTERYHAGWVATIDGAVAGTVRIEGDFLGCRLGAGAHHVELRFSPRSFRIGAMVSAAAAVLLAGVLAGWPRLDRAPADTVR
jgi:hypothetical protein